MAMGEPTIAEFSRMMGISTPNAAYKIGSLVKKGYVEKIQSTTDRREYFLRPTQKYIDYYSISYSYLHTVIERVRKRFPAEDCDKMEQMLSVISTELMPELDMLVNSLREFVSEKREEQNVQKLCDHLDYIANLIGIDHIGLGYDFDDYLGGEALGSFSSNLDSPSADGVSNEAEAYNLILEMKKRGYSQEDCDKVAYKNFYRVFKQVLK